MPKHGEAVATHLGILAKYGVFTEQEVFAILGAYLNDDTRSVTDILRELEPA